MFSLIIIELFGYDKLKRLADTWRRRRVIEGVTRVRGDVEETFEDSKMQKIASAALPKGY